MVLPARYEPVHRLGAGGGGEVWSVRDRVSGRVLALKVLSAGAGEAEVGALVREAVALSGLEGLGVPRVVGFGTLADGRRYMVRELVEGRSLEQVLQAAGEGERTAVPAWLEALATACEELTAVHRGGLLHGDVKPANIIVGADGRGTLVDLGLAAPWREGGSAAQGLTPKYAAPELFEGERLTVRAEVYALGATLAEALERRGADLEPETRAALAKVAARATEKAASARWPSVDELGSALRRAAHMPAAQPLAVAPWPITGLDAPAQALLEQVRALAPGGAIAVEGPAGAGKTTLLRRLAWTLGVEGRAVAAIERPSSGLAMAEALELELAQIAGQPSPVLVVDDGEHLDGRGRAALERALGEGARLVSAVPRETLRGLGGRDPAAFIVPPLEPSDAEELVRRSVPSLPEGLRGHLIDRTGGRPGLLRAAVRRLSGRAIVTVEDVDAALGAGSPSLAPVSAGRGRDFELLERALDTGRFDEAEGLLRGVGEARSSDERIRSGLARARIAVGRGDPPGAIEALASIEAAALQGPHRRSWKLWRARAAVRAGDYATALTFATDAATADPADALSADAMSVRGVALALTGEDAAAREVLDEAVRVASAVGGARVEALALGSSAFAHQRAGRTSDARAAYEASLAAAEKANDAATVGTMRLNLAAMAQAEGELAQALAHYEAAVDMGRRAGNGATVTQALLNLSNLDLYLGRWARARGSIDELAARREELSTNTRAQLLGLEAEHAARTGDAERAARHYEQTAQAWEQQGRAHDAAESRLEGLLVRARVAKESPAVLSRELEAVRTALGESGFGEHGALAELVKGTIALVAGNEEGARRSFDRAIDRALKEGRREWAWQALDARARLAASQGSAATARRDTEAALAMLEETAAKLPRDLREVFWNDPRRRGLREGHAATVIASAAISSHGAPLSVSTHGLITGGNTSLFTGPRLAEDRLARVLEITRELAAEHDVPNLLEKVTDHAVALLGAERGFVLLVGDAGELEAHTSRDRKKGDDPHGQFSRSVADRVLESGEAVVTISARDDARLAEAVSVHQLMIQSVACVPIRGAPPVGRTIGVLYVETRLRSGVRFEQELPTLRAFADQAAIAIENARLLSENRARADELARANGDLAAARDDLARALGKRTEQLAEARRDLKQARAELRGHFGYAGLIGTSASMRRVYAVIDRVKDTDVPVLLTGESGTGKEVVARAVHQAGPRGKRPFIGVNCGAIPANLLESELFGSVRGAFTGADRDRRGLFQEADGGTLLLDEIGEMPLAMQAGLLRVLEEKRVRPLGGTREEPVDVRIIAATHRDLGEMVAAKAFREDLYYRLHVVEIHVPALRDRVEDIPPLLDHFLSLFSARYRRERKSVSRPALRKLCAQPWPGNVRQLEHVLLSAWLMSEGPEILAEDLELPNTGTRASRPPPEGSLERVRPVSHPPRAETESQHRKGERERILSALTACNWNRVQAAKMIGLPRRTFYRRLKEFGIL
jgi:transcriptional regulator with GAF, ATPase, and Fis domain